MSRLSPAAKRIMTEARELAEPTDQYAAAPLEENMFEWHFTIAGPKDTEFEGGRYHGRIILPPEYPMKPPNIVLLTPNGRFEVGTKICLSISAHHPESWQPSWSIRTVLVALIGFLPTKDNGIGALDYTTSERKVLAQKSLYWKCPTCGVNMMTALAEENTAEPLNAAEQEALEKMHSMGFRAPRSRSTSEVKADEPQNKTSSCRRTAVPSPEGGSKPNVGDLALAPESLANNEAGHDDVPASHAVPPLRSRKVRGQGDGDPARTRLAQTTKIAAAKPMPSPSGWSSTILLLGLLLAIAVLIYRKYARASEGRQD